MPPIANDVSLYADQGSSPIHRYLERQIIQPPRQSSLKISGVDSSLLEQYFGKLPSTQFSNYLLKIYFENEYPIFPVLNQVDTYSSFYQIMEAKLARIVHRKLSLDTLKNLYFANLIFALSASNLECSHGSLGQSDNLYNRDYYLQIADELGDMLCDDLDVIQKIQAYLLRGQIALCRPCDPGLWNISSIICSSVIKNGFYDEKVISLEKDPKKLDIKRRCFWSAYLLDRYVCLCISKPHLIDEFCITTKYFEAVDDDACTEYSSKSYSLFYIKYFRTISEIKTFLYTKLSGFDQLNVEETKATLLTRLNETRQDFEEFSNQFNGRSNFYEGYLSLLYYQAICLLYKKEPSEKLLRASGQVIDIFQGMSDKQKLTYRILSVSSLFSASVMYNYCISKLNQIPTDITVQDIQVKCDESIVVLDRINDSDRENIVSLCASVMKKMAATAIRHLASSDKNPLDDSYELDSLLELVRSFDSWEDIKDGSKLV